MIRKNKILYKFLREGLKSEYGDCTWVVGQWKKEDNISLCSRGFHASKTPLQALGYVKGEIIATLEVKGKGIKEDDKEVWSEMKIVKAYRWQKKDSVALSIYAAELCIQNFEKLYPNDKRPRYAIEAAKKWLAYPTPQNETAAYSAANSAYSAANSAANSAYSAAFKKLTKRIDTWFIKRLKSLEEYK